MSNTTDYHMTPFKEGEFNPQVIIAFGNNNNMLYCL